MQTKPNISYLTDIFFGYGNLATLPSLLKKYSIRRPLVITDKGVVNAGIVERLNIDPTIVFDKVETNPTEAMAYAASDMYMQLEGDGIVAVGGGSPIDLAKCVALLAHHEKPLEQYAMVNGGSSKISSNLPPLF